jgi:Glycosyl hydrolases family 2, TIM barrel domain/Glycosyl hydrolases family 2, sugar binding domain/Glycosyl hydrolases family 2/Beta galactosidase small chain/Beta-galactosidase, domain 4
LERTLKLILLILTCVLAGGVCKAQLQSTTQIRYLSGTGTNDPVLWDFFCTEGRKSGVWTKIPVPSNWELQGFGSYQYGGDRQHSTNPFPKEQGKYRFQFEVPATWKTRVVRLVFEGSMTDTEVWVNGKSAGPVHQGSFYRFKYDITSLLKFGEPNLLEVIVSKESTTAGVNNAERLGDYWNFGGIFRPVYLESFPTSFIDWTAIDARADGSFRVEVNLSGNASEVVGQILDSDGRTVGKPFTMSIHSGERKVTLQTTIAKPKLWTAETPDLYRIRLSITNKSRAVHTISERFGFRTFEVRKGDGLYLNGQRILLRGVNRHSFWPDTGRALNKQLSYDDVKLIKEMNMNAVRMSHYPPDVHFLEACDELGLYVLDELAGWQRAYDKDSARRLIGQMIQRDVNHPSILFWDNGNEGGWNTEVDDDFARWDPQKREVLHPWEKFRLINTDHYEKFDSHARLSNGPDIYMPTEFLHGLYDGGIGSGMWDYWELIRTSKVGGGGFFWALVDECVKRTDQNGKLDCAGNRAPDGIVGPYRERKGSFNTVREIWSPVYLKVNTDKSSVQLHLENRYDFTNLNSCSFKWSLARFPGPDEGRKGHTVISSGLLKAPNVPPHQSGQLRFALPASRGNADVLYITVTDPTNREIWTWSQSLRKAELPASIAAKPLKLVENKNSLSVSNGNVELSFNKNNGTLVTVTNSGREIPLGQGPNLIAYQRNDRKYQTAARPDGMYSCQSRREGEAVVIEATSSSNLKNIRWRISSDSKSRLVANLDYEYSFTGTVDILGIGFAAAEQSFRTIRWLGMGPYRVWQNRLQGTGLDVWQNAYNDSTPGQSWLFPEFKGYFGEFRWARFDTIAGPFTIASENAHSFLGLLKPKDGVNGLLDLPDVGIAVLDVIPAMRNKFHTTDEIGPQSKAKQVSGVVKRSIQFRFGE